MRGAPRDPERAKRWLAFLRNYREVFAAMDFFTVPTITFGALCCFFVISHDNHSKQNEVFGRHSLWYVARGGLKYAAMLATKLSWAHKTQVWTGPLGVSLTGERCDQEARP